MKIINKILSAGIIALVLITVTPKITKAQDSYISNQEFYDYLQPYGTWVSDPQYGNVWVPDVDEDFRPYATRGHWVLTDYGNTWVSEYPWGWATFHYGRWRFDDYYGWEWIPGHHWAPAWVSWRHGGGYYGWAPLLPGISLSISFGGGYHVPDNYWVCAPQAYINRPNIYHYYAPPSRSITIIHNTTIINNTYVNNNQTYIAGPRPQEIRQVTHQNVRVYNISNASRPGSVTINRNTINIYRPAVNQVANARPARVINATAYKQQNPNQAIAQRGQGGAPAFNHNNAARLAIAAKAPTPDARIVHVNPVVNRPSNVQPNHPMQPVANRAGQPAVNPAANRTNNVQPNRVAQPVANRTGQSAVNPASNRPNTVQPNRPAQPVANRQGHQTTSPAQQGRPQPNSHQHQPQPVVQQAQQPAQQAQQRQQQQAAQQAQQRQQQQAAKQKQQQQAAQQAQQRQQQAAWQAQQRQQQQAAQQAQQRQQQAAQQAQQRQQQQAAQQAQQRQQQQAAQQAQQRQQQAAQQAQQRQQQQAAQQAQQRQQQAAQQAQKQKHPPHQDPPKQN